MKLIIFMSIVLLSSCGEQTNSRSQENDSQGNLGLGDALSNRGETLAKDENDSPNRSDSLADDRGDQLAPREGSIAPAKSATIQCVFNAVVTAAALDRKCVVWFYKAGKDFPRKFECSPNHPLTTLAKDNTCSITLYSAGEAKIAFEPIGTVESLNIVLDKVDNVYFVYEGTGSTNGSLSD